MSGVRSKHSQYTFYINHEKIGLRQHSLELRIVFVEKLIVWKERYNYLYLGNFFKLAIECVKEEEDLGNYSDFYDDFEKFRVLSMKFFKENDEANAAKKKDHHGRSTKNT